ncbi:MAG: twin arginine-targeting protein translocase TatC [Candidatus Lindowbacteria bacterium RIFCSPLOWO2_12_FULL_62_27]|nr:MAG: twin arginine-targeting protein translocase TatC [Candidatus Lindowbacteria bacterium RIFCSPLOWO2_12_FULL_62_27]OGH58774.1 MAG: twin arginine-targeting protein translocase TatC [Candidatus Lindowbacteria bacterium RIFCSPLOWO2_02_FULL_62_12]
MSDPVEESISPPDKRMSFLDHLEELRWCLIRSLIALAVGFVGSLFFVRRLLAFLEWPLRQAGVGLADAPGPLRTLSVAESFTALLTLAAFAGLAVALPYLLFEIWQFIAPGLTRKERGAVAPLLIFGTAFFFAGVAFGHQVLLPPALRYFLTLNTDFGLAAEWRILDYMKFTLSMLLVCGIMAELPVLTVVLARFGIVSAPFLTHYWRHAIVILFVLAALLTPSTDSLTMILLAGPLIALYGVSIVLAKIFYKPLSS